MNLCGKCEKVLPPKSDDYVKCGKCKASYHFICCKMPQDLWFSKSKKHKERWKCKDCRDLEQASSNAIMGPFAPEENLFTYTDSTVQNVFQLSFNKHMDVMDNMESTLQTILTEIKDLRDDIANRRVRLDDGPVIRTSTSVDMRRLGHLIIEPQNREDYEILDTEKLPLNKLHKINQEETISSNQKETPTQNTDVNAETNIINTTKQLEMEQNLPPLLHKRVSYASQDLMKTDIIGNDETNTNEERTEVKKERSRRASILLQDTKQ